MTAIFGGLFGLATVTSVVALLIQGSTPPSERSLAVASGAPSATPTGAAAAKAGGAPTGRRTRTPIPGPWRISELAKDPGVAIVSGAFERKSFLDTLAEKGVPTPQAYRVLKAFEGVKKLDRPGRRDKFSIALERASKRVRGFEYEVTPSEIFQARENEQGLLAATKLDLKIAEEEVQSAVYIGKDLSAACKSSGLEDGITDTLDDALVGRLSTESLKEGGALRFIAVEETALGLFSKYKRIVALEYRPPDPSDRPTRMYWFAGQEARGYFDERGRQPDGSGWQSPTPGAPVTSKFNPKRMHPVLKKVMPHNGTDFGAPTGTPVYSVYKGVVDFVGMHGPSGNLVTVTHPNGIQTGYAHLSRFAPGIKAGDKVGARQLVGYVGSTGRSTGPHLHFSAKRDGKYFDAESLRFDAERVMPAADRPAFLAAKAELDARLDAIPLPEPPSEAAPPAKPEPNAEAPSAAVDPATEPRAPDAPAAAASDAKKPDPSEPETDMGQDTEEGVPIPAPPLTGESKPSAKANKAGAKRDER